MKHLYTLVFAVLLAFAGGVSAQSVPDTVGSANNYYCNFEDSAECSAWTFVNGALANQWYIGTAANNIYDGGTSLYVSNNGGATHSYTNGSPSTTYVYRELYFEEGYYTCFFSWTGNGNQEDYALAAIVPASVQFVPDEGLMPGMGWDTLPPEWINIGRNDYNSRVKGLSGISYGWGGQSNKFRITTPGVYRLVYVWHNDDGSYGNNPPMAIDNIQIDWQSCPWVKNLRVLATTDSSITIAWSPGGNETHWSVSCNNWIETDDTVYTIEGLYNSTEYWINVFSICDSFGQSPEEVFVARTDCGLYRVPYEIDFTSNNWTSHSGYDRCWYMGGAGTGYFSEFGHNILLIKSRNDILPLPEYTYNSYAVIPELREPIDSLYLRCTIMCQENTMHSTTIAVIGIMSDPADFSTFVSIDTLDFHEEDNYSSHLYEKDLAGYGQYGNHIAIAAAAPQLLGETYCDNHVIIDKIRITKTNTNSYITDLKVLPRDTSILVYWRDFGSASRWLVEIPQEYGVCDSTISLVVQDTFAILNGLHPAQYGRVQVRALCSNGDTGAMAERYFYTRCTTIEHSELPYTTSFEEMWNDEYREINYCWRGMSIGNSITPQIWGSNVRTGYNNLGFETSSNHYGYVVLPLFEDTLSHLAMSFFARKDAASHNPTLFVGVMSNPDDVSTFDTVATFTPEIEYTKFQVGFNNYDVTGHWIAIMCYSNIFSRTYVDDVTISENTPCNEILTPHAIASGDSLELSWNYNGQATLFEVVWDYNDFDPVNAVNRDTVSGDNLTIANIANFHKMVAYIRPLCGSIETIWQGPVEAYFGINILVNGTTLSARGCQFTIYDNGFTGQYSDSFDGSMVLLPPDSTKAFAITGSYNTESCCDHLYFYDGTSISDPLLAQLQGNGVIDTIYSHGPVTIRFRTDASVIRDGFELFADCIDAPSCSQIATVSVDDVSLSSAEVRWTMLYSKLPAPDSVLLRWADTLGNSDSVYATTNPFVITNLAAGTNYTLTASSMCASTAINVPSVNFTTLDYGCIEYDSTQSFFDTISYYFSWDMHNSNQTNSLPSQSYYNYSYSQQIYYRSELDTGVITSMSLKSAFIRDPIRKYKIFLAQVPDSTLTQFIYPQGMTKVYDGDSVELVSNQWVEFKLATSFHYDGTGNLLVTFVDTSGYYTGSNYWLYHESQGSSVYAYRDSEPYPDDNSSCQNYYTTNARNNIIFSNKTCIQMGSCIAPIVKTTKLTSDHISIMWIPDSCAHNWDVEHRIYGESQWITDLSATTQTTYTFENLLPYTTYEVRVTVNGDSHYSTTLVLKTVCNDFPVPFFEDFTDIQFGDYGLPICWIKGAGQTYPVLSGGALRGDMCLYNYSYSSNEYFTLPKLDAPMDSLNLFFVMKSYYDQVGVGVMTNPNDINSFHSIASISGTGNWQPYQFSLAGMPQGHIAFVSLQGDNGHYIDRIEVTYNNDCSRPDSIRLARKTATTANIEWKPTGASQYIVRYTELYNPMDSAITIVTNNPHVKLTSLTGSQEYRVVVRGICAPGDTSYESMDFFFTTGCSIQDVPFTETFEDYGYGTYTHSPTCWYYGSYHEDYPFISRSYNHTQDGYNSMFLYCYDKNQEDHTTYLTLPEIELDTLTVSNLQAVFYGYTPNSNSKHRVIVGVCDTANMMSTFTPVDTIIIESNKWDIYEVTFDSYTGNGKYITFVSSVASGNKYSYPFIDDLTIEPIPPCQRPNNLYANEESATANTIEIGWNDRSGATQWIVEYGDKGFTPGTGTQVVANSNPFTLTGIHRGYEGEFYVKAVCSNESSSDWSRRPCRFKTVCDTMSDIVVACDSYNWHGTTYNSSITGPLYDAPDIPSCDSLVVLRLTIKHSTEGTEAQSACDSYIWYGNTYTASTTAPTHHLTNAVGCDSTAHLNLTIRYSTEGTESQTACDSYTWYGNTYTASTTAPTHLLTNAVGCDSTAHLNLTMKYSTTATEQVVTCDRSSYTWRGQTFTESTNSATYTLPNAVGCDSVITLHLNMSHSDTGIETVDACDSYTWHGNTYTASTNTATYETSTVTGCDSTVTLHLTVRYSNAANFSHIACDSYTWHGNTYTASTTTPTYTSTNIAGCDSTTTLLLTILNSTSSNDVVSACDSYQWHGTTYTASTSSPSFITTNAAGCDSVIHLNLTVRYSSEGTLTLTACDSYTWHGTTYTASTNTPTWLTLNNAGCDSLVTLNLTVNYSNTGVDNQTACDSYTWHGNTYTASTNTPTYMSTNIMGCDSTTTLHLTVNYINSGIETVSECDSYLWHGTVYTASTNTPTFMSTNAAGCDSTTTLHLTLNYSSSSIDNVTACDSYRWHGIDYTTSTNTPTFATTNAVGCDSTVVLHLTVNYSNTGIDNQTACDSYTWHGITYTASIDTVTFVETNAAGCDSIVTLHLTVNYSNSGSESATACDSYTWHGNTYTISGTPTYQTTNTAGCDSTVTLTLTINNSTSSTVTQTACDSYTWYGNTYTVSGTPTYQTTNAAGCDSTVTLTLTINNSTTSTVAQTACDSYTWNGNTFTSSDTAVYQTSNAAGCDSTATLYLTINFSNTSSETATECDSYTWNGETYTESGTYTYQTSNVAGCDSTVTMYLTVNFSSTSSDTATECDSYTWNGETYTESGTYTYQTSNAAGCDSTATLMLTVNYSSQVTIADTATGSYEWNDETYTESGTYTWTGTNSNGCDSTVTLHLYIQEVGINTVDNENAVNVYPNPTSGVLNIDADGISAIEVYDINGRLVATFGAVNKINIATLPAGAYTIRIKTTQNHHIRRIILK